MRATQYIPDIYRLQIFLHNHYNHRIDHKEASITSIAMFIHQLSGLPVRLSYHLNHIVIFTTLYFS